MAWGSRPSLGAAFLGEDTPARIVERARAAEAAGFASLWFIEDYFQTGAFALAGAAAAVTARIAIGTAVVNPYTRHPALIAMETATLAGIAPGRVVLGLGTGVHRWIAGQMRIPAPRPLATLGECVDVIRRLWAGERVTHEGQGFSLADVALEYKPAQPELPIVLGVKGPRALGLAGAVADGVVCSIMSSPAHVRRVRETIAPARRQSGRGRCPVLAYVPVAIGRDGAAARRSVRPLLARYLAHLHGQTILVEAGGAESRTLAIRAARSAARRARPSSPRTRSTPSRSPALPITRGNGSSPGSRRASTPPLPCPSARPTLSTSPDSSRPSCWGRSRRGPTTPEPRA